MSDEISIQSYRYRYSAQFVADSPALLTTILRPTDCVLADVNVLRLHPAIQQAVQTADRIDIDPSESAKSYGELAPIIEHLIDRRFTKTGRLVAIGGGVVQDITAFTASIFARGVDWLFFPTNLLSQCDSCIGSKTSINFGRFKNQLGGFFPPRAVYIDFAFLDTLPAREWRSGFGEMMHYFLVDGEEAFAWGTEHLDRAGHDRDTLRQMVHRSLTIKKAMVERDEFDEGPRNVFNYGHSFGHAIESSTDFSVPHGIAVSFGMDLANVVSSHLGLVSMAVRNRVRETLARVWDGTSLDALDFARFLAALGRDKKNEGAEIKVILTKGIGNMFKTTLPLSDPSIEPLMRKYFSDRLFEKAL